MCAFGPCVSALECLFFQSFESPTSAFSILDWAMIWGGRKTHGEI